MTIELDDRVRAGAAHPRDRATLAAVHRTISTSTPASTVEALAYELRRGLSCLDDPANVERLGRCDDAAMKEIVVRLRSRKSRNVAWLPAWSDADIANLVTVRRSLREGKA